jgi:uncharacterized phiE125 gp8 family phage protein
MRSYTLVTPPTKEPVSLTELKEHARIEHTDDDPILERLIIAAREFVERATRRALMTQTWKVTLDNFPDGDIELARPPLISVLTVVYEDTAGVTQTFPASSYYVDNKSIVGRVSLEDGYVWPSTEARIATVVVSYIAGYGSDEASVPQSLRLAVMMLATHWYEHREPVTEDKLENVSWGFKNLIWSYKVPN